MRRSALLLFLKFTECCSSLEAHVMFITRDEICPQGVLGFTRLGCIVKFPFMVYAAKCSFAGMQGGGARENCNSSRLDLFNEVHLLPWGASICVEFNTFLSCQAMETEFDFCHVQDSICGLHCMGRICRWSLRHCSSLTYFLVLFQRCLQPTWVLPWPTCCLW